MKPRVIIFSTAYYPLIGGAEVAMKETTDRLTDWSFDLITARIQPGLKSTEQHGNVTIHRCGFGLPIDKYLLPVFGVWRAMRISRAKDVALIWSLMASYGGFAALAYTWIRPRTRMLLTLQEGDPLEYIAKRVGVFAPVFKRIFVRANAVHAISTFLASWATQQGFTGTPEVIPNGVHIEAFAKPIDATTRERIRHEAGFGPSDTVIASASRLVLKNGMDDLVRSLVDLPPTYKAWIIGEGDDREKLQVLAEKKGVKDRVVFAGAKPNTELPSLLRSADVFCRPSLSEGLGIAFLEAMAAELPVVATMVGGIADFLQDGETGVVCVPREPETIARAIERVTTDASLRSHIIHSASKMVAERYAWGSIAPRIDALMKKLVA